MPDHTSLLRRVAFFEEVDNETLLHISTCLRPLHFAKDERIVGQDDAGDSLFIIQEGRVKVVLYGDTGREMILSIFSPGDFFGEMSLLDGQPRSANVIAIDDAEVLVLSRDDFVSHLRARPDAALKILAEMSKRLRRADEIIGNLALLDVYGRVAHALMQLAQQEGEKRDEGIYIRERPTQHELAAQIGTRRESVSRVLSDLQRRGYLFMQGKSMLLTHGFAEKDIGQDFRRDQDG